jgi:hypothetical protein
MQEWSRRLDRFKKTMLLCAYDNCQLIKVWFSSTKGKKRKV